MAVGSSRPPIAADPPPVEDPNKDSHVMPIRVISILRPKTIARAAGAFAVTALAVAPALAGPTTTSISSSKNTAVYGETVDFTATVWGATPTGTVTILKGAAVGSAALGLLDARTAFSAGGDHTCALTATSGVACWGYNNDGQLGDGNKPTDSDVPVTVPNLSGVVAVSAGENFTCALTESGSVYCWGENFYGQLGNGTNTESSVPVQVSGLTDATAIAAGSFHACAITASGPVKCWGAGEPLGNNSAANSNVPVNVSGLSGVSAIGAGNDHTCAIDGSGYVWCWGLSSDGQVGDGATDTRLTPVKIASLGTAKSIGLGNSHTCAVTTPGAVYCWGYNDTGQVGVGTTGNEILSPTAVPALSSGIASVTAGNDHSCALLDTGGVICWGENGYGQLGDGDAPNDSTAPEDVQGLTTGVRAIAAGGRHTCALTGGDALQCWGVNEYGQLGTGNVAFSSDVPDSVTGHGDGAAVIPAQTTVSVSTADLSAGTHSITARYDGDTGNATSTSPRLSLVVAKGKTKVKKIKLTPKKPKTGKSVRIKVEMKAKAPASGKPEGKVVIKDGKKKLGKFKVNKKGKASIKVKSLSAGSHTIKAKYQGDKNWKKSDDTKKVTVKE